MSERKVLNKYYPPDFDPSKIGKTHGSGGGQKTVRLMTPFSMRCNRCGEYMYKGKKFNARKETVNNETYYSIKIFRFYIKCTRCSAEITFKTDPKNADYVAENGASRNFEPWRDESTAEDEVKLSKLEEEENNPMKALENRTADSKREMDILDALDEIRTRNARNERVDAQNVLDKIVATAETLEEKKTREEEEDEELAKAIFKTADGQVVKRVVDDPTPVTVAKPLSKPAFAPMQTKKRKPTTSTSSLGVVIKKQKA